MKNKIKTVVYLSLMFSQILPAFVYASSGSGKQAMLGKEASQNSQIESVNVIVVKEVPKLTIQAVGNPACNSNGESFSTLVQDTAAVNLNQPAACFSLKSGKVSAQNILKVVSVIETRIVKVKNTIPLVLLPQVSSFPVPASQPTTFAVPSFEVFTIIVSVATLFFRKRYIQSVNNSVTHLTFQELKVMRC